MARRKLILFDLDGTLISPGPIPRETLSMVIGRALGSTVALQVADVAGSIDPAIVRAAIRRGQWSGANEAEFINGILKEYAERVEEELTGTNRVSLYDGALELLHGCRKLGWATAILTGNIRRVAESKLKGTGLPGLFDFGIFGDDGNRREDLPFLASERAWAALGNPYPMSTVMLVGDTPADAQIAQIAGIPSLIVDRRNDQAWSDAIIAESPTAVTNSLVPTEEIIDLMKGM